MTERTTEVGTASGLETEQGDAMETETETKRETREPWRLPRTGVALTLVVAVAAVAACDVTNPGPVQDRFLNDRSAQEGILNGIKVAYKSALGTCDNNLGVDGGVAVRELLPSGNPGSCGVSVQEGLGNLNPDETSGVWNQAQNARWSAEDAITRFDSTLEGSAFDSSPAVAEAHVWAGYANRMMGEHFCEAVIDGGSAEPHTVFFERAEQFFTDAIGVAENAGEAHLANAARAGRAQVRVHLGNWSGAVQDAQSVPDGFSFEIPFHAVSQDQYNMFHWGQVGQPYRTVSAWDTPYGVYYARTDSIGDPDPRVEWDEHPDFEFGDLARFDMRIPLWVQQKHTSNAAPITLADKREMRLIVAEQMLIEGDWEAAMDTVDQLRQEADAPSWSEVDGALVGGGASTEAEAWTLFRFERGIELWLEARRMADLRRWEANDRPGQLQPLEDPSDPASRLNADRDLCYPIPDSERETNPNVPTVSG